MGKEAVVARKKAAECVALAARESMEERSAVLMAMARSWVTLANQMDRLEGTRAPVDAAKRRARKSED